MMFQNQLGQDLNMPQDKNSQTPPADETTLTTEGSEMTTSNAVQEEQAVPAVEAQPKTAVAA